jgi:zona occludens toxin (predicted ATPase)
MGGWARESRGASNIDRDVNGAWLKSAAMPALAAAAALIKTEIALQYRHRHRQRLGVEERERDQQQQQQQHRTIDITNTASLNRTPNE